MAVKTSYIVKFWLTVDFDCEYREYSCGANEDEWQYYMDVLGGATCSYREDKIVYFRNLLGLPAIDSVLRDIFSGEYELDGLGYYDGIINIVFEQRTSENTRIF